MEIIKLFTDFVFCIIHDAWSLFYYPRWMEMFGLWMCQRYGVHFFFFTWPVQRRVLEDDIMSPISKFRSVFNNYIFLLTRNFREIWNCRNDTNYIFILVCNHWWNFAWHLIRFSMWILMTLGAKTPFRACEPKEPWDY